MSGILKAAQEAGIDRVIDIEQDKDRIQRSGPGRVLAALGPLLLADQA